jgi:uncharacterized membrane protein YphA (DoxX/SURF4 family)
MEKSKLASLLLRIGLAFVFLYAAISAFVIPEAWIGFYPEWMREVVPDSALLAFHSVAEIILAIWLLSGRWTFYAAVFSGLWVLGILLGTLQFFFVTFRDVAILLSAVALAILNKR